MDTNTSDGKLYFTGEIMFTLHVKAYLCYRSEYLWEQLKETEKEKWNNLAEAVANHFVIGNYK